MGEAERGTEAPEQACIGVAKDTSRQVHSGNFCTRKRRGHLQESDDGMSKEQGLLELLDA